MKAFLLIVFFTGLVLVVLNDTLKRPPPIVEYRYLPRDLDTYMRESTYFMLPVDATIGDRINMSHDS
jgi:hypothetical protein